MKSIAKLLTEPLKPGSIFYIERPPVEAKVCQEITKEGCIIRLKSPQKTGKTSLVLRLLKYSSEVNYFTVYLDFQLADEDTFTSVDKFLRWFCANISKQLQLPVAVNEYWDLEIGSKVSCTLYLKNYVLQKINTPIVLVLNKLDSILEYSNIASSFLSLLRSWHDAKHDALLQQLRLVLVYSTEFYIRLNINQSPFNVGLLVELPEFSIKQIQELALRYGLNWSSNIGNEYAFRLKCLLGGHPYLIRTFIDNLINNPNSDFEEIVQQSHTPTGIYSSYLRGLLATVIEHPELVSALKILLNNDEAILNDLIVYKLEMLGLIKVVQGRCIFYCELYKRYFTSQNLEELNVWQYIKKLQQENKNLKILLNNDQLTQLSNQRYFDAMLYQLWFMLQEEEAPMSIIILDIDHLRIYNDSNGYIKGDDCIKKVANAIQSVISSSNSLEITTARYSGGEFAILLPNIKVDLALEMAEKIRQKVKNLAIQQVDKYFGTTARLITVSLGVACTVINANKSPITLMEIARQALYNSKNDGRDCISVDIY